MRFWQETMFGHSNNFLYHTTPTIELVPKMYTFAPKQVWTFAAVHDLLTGNSFPLVSVTFILTSPAPLSNLTYIIWCYTCLPKVVLNSKAVRDYRPKSFYFIGRGELELDPTYPIV